MGEGDASALYRPSLFHGPLAISSKPGELGRNTFIRLWRQSWNILWWEGSVYRRQVHTESWNSVKYCGVKYCGVPDWAPPMGKEVDHAMKAGSEVKPEV